MPSTAPSALVPLKKIFEEPSMKSFFKFAVIIILSQIITYYIAGIIA